MGGKLVNTWAGRQKGSNFVPFPTITSPFPVFNNLKRMRKSSKSSGRRRRRTLTNFSFFSLSPLPSLKKLPLMLLLVGGKVSFCQRRSGKLVAFGRP